MKQTTLPPELLNDANKSLKDFHKEHYYKKVDYLKDHFTRMWTRFNFFLTVETALFGGKFLIQSGGGPVQFQWYIAMVGFFVSFIWYVMGAEDKYLVDLYREEIKLEFNKLQESLLPSSNGETVYYVGQVDHVSALQVKKTFYRWRVKAISTTTLAAIIPLLLTASWLLMLFYHLV